MSKSVLISIRPKWCELIANGEKTIEVRKTHPKMETPFKCYIYCTKPSFEYEDFIALENGRFIFGGGKVIGEFVCDRIIEWHYIPDPDESSDPGSMAYDVLTVDGEKTGLDYDDFEDYGKGAPLFGWHISNLVIYDEPKELSEFMKPCNPDPDGIPLFLQCKRLGENWCGSTILRPPQSYCYVEELP
jgi:predicted transcriptional regulator